MKKIALFIAFIIFSFLMISCGNKTSEKFDDKMIEQICSKYSEITKKPQDKIKIKAYFGTYNNCIALTFGDYDNPLEENIESLIVAGYCYNYSCEKILIYDKVTKTFLDFKNAYETNYISQNDVLKIIEKHKKCFPNYYTECIIKYGDEKRVLEDQLYEQIRKDYFNTLPKDLVDSFSVECPEGKDDEYKEQFIYILNHYGTYDNNVVITIRSDICMIPNSYHYETIAEIRFCYFYDILVYNTKDRKFLSLKDAYSSKKISKDNIKSIWEKHKEAYQYNYSEEIINSAIPANEGEQANFIGLDKKLDEEIRKNFLNTIPSSYYEEFNKIWSYAKMEKKIEYFPIIGYYGTYGNNVALTIALAKTRKNQSYYLHKVSDYQNVLVGDLIFYYYDREPIVYNKESKQFISIKDAYNQGEISKNELKKIWEKYKETFPCNYIKCY